MKNKFGWEIKKLGEICDILDNLRKPVTKKDRVNGEYPYYGATGIQDYVSNYIFDGKYVLVGEDGANWSANEKTSFIVDGKCWVNNHAHVVKIHENILDNWVVYYLNFMDLDEYISGAVIRKLNQASLRSILIPVPPLPAQHQIVSELDALSEIISKKKQQIEELDKLAQATFYDMFGDPVTNEKGWEVKKMKDLTTRINSGNTPNGGSNVYVQEGITFFRSQNVWKNNLVYEDIAFIDIKTHTSMSKSSLKHKDILMTKTGRFNTENSSLGRAALFLGEDDSANINGHVYLIRLKKNQVHGYILHILTCNAFREVIRNVCVGGIDKRQLNKNHIEEFSIIYPSIEHQQTFADILESINKQKSLINQSIVEVQQLFDYTMDKYFN